MTVERSAEQPWHVRTFKSLVDTLRIEGHRPSVKRRSGDLLHFAVHGLKISVSNDHSIFVRISSARPLFGSASAHAEEGTSHLIVFSPGKAVITRTSLTSDGYSSAEKSHTRAFVLPDWKPQDVPRGSKNVSSPKIFDEHQFEVIKIVTERFRPE